MRDDNAQVEVFLPLTLIGALKTSQRRKGGGHFRKSPFYLMAFFGIIIHEEAIYTHINRTLKRF